ncbi:MAG: hypothetical protein IKB97_04820 [Bacteroidaceae bacterium]|nr:hypothetical protein [Bacteroidaceae bacterium]MBR3595269.1 hypothetical protein [Candidatus Saccharibacteria bacterium]MBR6122147.1 hypothetical protein [Candidatus Saccharibacteria bacterium]
MRTDLEWQGPKLSWDHFRILLTVRGETRKNFYYDMCIKYKWSKEELKQKIKDMYYEDIIYPK